MVNESSSAKARILTRLRAVEGPVSGNDLAQELGMSRVAVWKHLEALREAGYDLEADRSGYRLASEGDFLFPWEFSDREGRIHYWEQTQSTMDRALELALSEPRGKAITVAESQTKGRGRCGHRWNSRRGGLFATLVLRPKILPCHAQRVEMAGGIALCEVLRELTDEPVSLEWPNDLYLGARKIAGILIEYLVEGEELKLVDLGIGVNVSNRAPAPGAISLSELPARTPSRCRLLTAFLDRFEALDLEREDLPAMWNRLSSPRKELAYEGK